MTAAARKRIAEAARARWQSHRTPTSTTGTNGDARGGAPSPVPALLDDYPGAKSGAGVFQKIISQMPPHHTYVELFAGTAAVLRMKRPAQASIVVDSDAAVCATLPLAALPPGTTVICADAISWLQKQRFRAGTVIYADPPYLSGVRSCQRDYYRREFDTPAQHKSLLAALNKLEPGIVAVLLSGYRSELYDRALAHWRRIDYQTATHRGPVTESLWCNFPEPGELHDYRFLGSNYRERERIKRKKLRWRKRLEKLPALERAAILAVLEELQDLPAVPGDGQ